MSDSHDPATIPAGWYGDPLQRGYERYWDGAAWTERTRPAGPRPMPEPARHERSSAGPDEGERRTQPHVPAGATAVPPHPFGTGLFPPGPTPRDPGAAGPRDAARPPEGERAGLQLATALQRALGMLVDSVLCLFLTFLATLGVWIPMMNRMEEWMLQHPGAQPPTDTATVQQIVTPHDTMVVLGVSLLVSVVYFTLLWAWRGASLGQLATGIRLTPAEADDDATRPDVMTCLVRALSYSLLAQWPMMAPFAVLFLLSGLSVLVHPARQSWPDRFAGTKVVQRRVVPPGRNSR